METGEAYFDVKHNEHVAFIVHTGVLKTRVLGTAFNIKKSDRHHDVQVSVARGKVQVSTSDTSLALLTKGRQINYDTSCGEYTLSDINPDYATGWQRAYISLKGSSFDELSEAFYSLYNTRLTAGREEIREHRYTLTLNKGTSEETALEIIAAIHQIKYRVENGDIILH